MVFVSNNQSPEVLKPGKQAFNFPPAPITSQLSTILGRRLFAPATMWRNHFNAAFLEKLLIKTIAIIGFIANKLVRSIAFITSRGSRALRPLGSLAGVKDTIIGSIRFHCSFVSSILILLHNQVLMSRFILR